MKTVKRLIVKGAKWALMDDVRPQYDKSFKKCICLSAAALAQFAVCMWIIFMRSDLGVGHGAGKQESHMFCTD